MFTFFENLIKPFPPEIPTRPPAKLLAFCWHYTRGVWPWLLLMSVLVTLIAMIEVMLFGFLAEIIDWLTNVDKENFLEQEGDTLMVIGAVGVFQESCRLKFKVMPPCLSRFQMVPFPG